MLLSVQCVCSGIYSVQRNNSKTNRHSCTFLISLLSLILKIMEKNELKSSLWIDLFLAEGTRFYNKSVAVTKLYLASLCIIIFFGHAFLFLMFCLREIISFLNSLSLCNGYIHLSGFNGRIYD